MRGQTHCFLGVGHAHAFHFEQDLARANYCDPVIRRSLAFSHTGFSRLLRDRLVGEEADPNFAAALHEPGNGHATRLDLAIADPARLQHFQAVLAESKLRATPGLAGHASALLLAVLNFFRHQHKNQPLVVSLWLLAKTLPRASPPAVPRAFSARGFRLYKPMSSRQSRHKSCGPR